MTERVVLLLMFRAVDDIQFILVERVLLDGNSSISPTEQVECQDGGLLDPVTTTFGICCSAPLSLMRSILMTFGNSYCASSKNSLKVSMLMSLMSVKGAAEGHCAWSQLSMA